MNLSKRFGYMFGFHIWCLGRNITVWRRDEDADKSESELVFTRRTNSS